MQTFYTNKKELRNTTHLNHAWHIYKGRNHKPVFLPNFRSNNVQFFKHKEVSEVADHTLCGFKGLSMLHIFMKGCTVKLCLACCYYL